MGADVNRSESADAIRAAIASGQPVGDQRAITAEHEAAHAVAYLACGYPLHRVEVKPEQVTVSTPEPERRPLFEMLVVSIAGLAIESRYRHFALAEEVAEAIDWHENGEDVDELGDIAPFVEHPDLAEHAYRAASLLLDAHADLHAEIADAVFERGTLSAADLAALPLTGARLRENAAPR